MRQGLSGVRLGGKHLLEDAGAAREPGIGLVLAV